MTETSVPDPAIFFPQLIVPGHEILIWADPDPYYFIQDTRKFNLQVDDLLSIWQHIVLNGHKKRRGRLQILPDP